MKNAIIFLTAIFCSILTTYGQSYADRQEFAVTNPNSYELMQFGLTPINQYTGKANVGFPLFSMNLDGLEVPFNLSYDTGGIRVSQEATWVGLGWNLGGIPTISQKINQRNDIGNKPTISVGDRGYCYEPKLPSYNPVDGKPIETEEITYINFVNNNGGDGVPYSQLDTQPDVFTANLIGSTVKFQLTQEADTGTIQALILNDSNAIVTYYDEDENDNRVRYFDVRDENGFLYEFRHVEYTTTWSQPGGVPGIDDIDPLDITGSYNDGTTYNASWENLIPSTWYIDRIVSPDGDSLEYIYDHELDGAINVSIGHPQYNGTTTITMCGSDQNNGNVNNGWQAGFFEQVVATRTIQQNVILSQVVHTSTGNKAIFKTNEREDIFPWLNAPLNYLEGFNPYNSIPLDAEPKKLYEIEVVSGLNTPIKTIELQHSYFNNYKLGDNDAKSYIRLKLDGFSYHDQQYAFKYKCDDALPKKHSKSVDFWGFYNGVENVRRTPAVQLDGSLCLLENPEVTNLDGEYTGAIKGSNSEAGLIGNLIEIRYPTGGTTSFEYEGNTATLDLSDPALTPDDFNYPYLLYHSVEPGFPKTGVANSNFKIMPVGGLRIKSVTNNDASGNPLIRKSYQYDETKPNGDIASSGVLMDALYHFRSNILLLDSFNVTHSNITISSGNVFFTAGSAMGSHIGYGRVEEIIDNINGTVDIGRIATTYVNKPNESLRTGSDGLKFLVENPPVNYEDANGKILRQEIYDQTGNPEQIVENEYEFVENFFPIGYKIYYGSITQEFAGIPLGQQFVNDYYHFSPQKYVALAELNTTTSILEDGDVVATSQNQFNALNRLTSSEVSTSRDATTKRTEYYYPYDTNYNVNSFTYSRDLTVLNQIDQPLYQRFYENNELLGHQLTRYFIFPGSLTKPESVHYSKEDSDLQSMEERVKYERYDINGNLIQYRQTEGIPVAAIWGYNGQYIIAKIENATYAQIEALPNFGSGFTIGNTGLSNVQKLTLRTHASLSDAMVTIYDHEPLVGPTKVEDTRSYETFYEYDDFNRLVAVRDEENNLLEEYKYQYADVQTYPQNELSECFDALIIEGIDAIPTPQNVNMTIQVSGGVGNYQYQWYYGEGPTLREADFQANPISTTGGLNWIICCDDRKYIRVVVTSGTQTKTIQFSNQDFQTECPENPCENPF